MVSDFITSPHDSPHAARRRALWAIPLVVLILLGADRLWTVVQQAGEPLAAAEWIWIKGMNRWSGPCAFYVWKDFELTEIPQRVTLSVLGDEEYAVHLNGERVGSNRYTSGAKPDLYDVTPLLRLGRNRLVAHLRSTYSYGGLLAVLRAEDSEVPILVTGDDWHVSRRRVTRLTQPELAIDRPERAIVVARPPTGRWGSAAEGVPRPLNAELILGGPALGARRLLVPDGEWRRRRSRRPFRARALGGNVLFDWEEARTGYLMLFFPKLEEEALGLVYLGIELPDPLWHPPDASVIALAGEKHWIDSVPRAFRYALVVGIEAATDARIAPTDSEKLAPIVAGQRQQGVFGLEAPRLRTTIENEVWGELEGFAGDSEGESR